MEGSRSYGVVAGVKGSSRDGSGDGKVVGRRGFVPLSLSVKIAKFKTW